MGIYYSAEIVVGLPYDELEDHYNQILTVDKEEVDEDDYNEGFYEWYEGLGLSRISPYYDASNDDCLIGVTVLETSSYRYEEIDESTLKNLIAEASVDFQQATGLQGKIYLTPHGG